MDKDYLLEAIQDAPAKLKSYKPGTDEYKDALRAFTELERIYNERFKNETDRDDLNFKKTMDTKKFNAERKEKAEELKVERDKGGVTKGMLFSAGVGLLSLGLVLHAETVGVITSRCLTGILRKVL